MKMTVVGIGAEGWAGLPESTREVIDGAGVLIGGTRHLDLIPAEVAPAADRLGWPSPLREALPELLERLAGHHVVALASGDPMVSGIGSTLVEFLGPEQVEIIPAVSSVAWARARMRWSAESTKTVTLVGREMRTLLPHLVPNARIIVLVSGSGAGQAVADILCEAGHQDARLTVLADLGAPNESRIETRADDSQPDTPDLAVLAIDCGVGSTWPTLPGLPDAAFEHDGQITKRDLRALALSRLAPQPGELLWDVGAGAGSVGIEWARADPRCRTIAIERDPDRADRITRNAARLGVPGLEVVRGPAPAALVDLAVPNAIFVGGGGTDLATIDACWAALAPAGRFVMHAVTAETESVLLERFRSHGGELTRIGIERAESLGGFTGWTPARTVTQWAVTKERGIA